MKRHAGFSLLEAIVIMVIAGILAAIAIPRFTDSESKATWYNEQVKAAVRYAQRQAVAQRRCVFVQVTLSQVALFYGDDNCLITATPLTFLASTVPGRAPGSAYVLDAPTGVTLVPPTPVSFAFTGLGRTSTGAGVAFTFGSKAVTVTAETGYVP
jgi:MSHA pilin protein MshC